MADTRHTVQQFYADFTRSKIGLLIDDASSPERAAIIVPAETANSDKINLIARLTGGLFFVAMPQSRVNAFMLSRMSRPATSQRALKESNPLIDMCVTVEAREGVTTGISASDRSVTISILGEKIPNPRKIVSPGHIFPVQTREGGLLVRTAIPEGAIDIVIECGFSDAALFVDLIGSDGSFLSRDAVTLLSKEYKIPCINLSTLTQERLQSQALVYKVTEARLPTEFAGEVNAIIYKSHVHSGEHLALVKGDITTPEPILTRVQTEATIQDVFGGSASNTRKQLHQALLQIGARGRGVLVYLRKPQEGFLKDQLSEALLPSSRMTLMRDYGIGAQILRDLGVAKIELLTNTKKNLVGLKTFGIDIVAQTPLQLEEIHP